MTCTGQKCSLQKSGSKITLVYLAPHLEFLGDSYSFSGSVTTPPSCSISCGVIGEDIFEQYAPYKTIGE